MSPPLFAKVLDLIERVRDFAAMLEVRSVSVSNFSGVGI